MKPHIVLATASLLLALLASPRPTAYSQAAGGRAERETPVVYGQVLFGTCDNSSYAALRSIGKDTSDRTVPFRCQAASVDFYDKQYKRISIAFSAAPGSPGISGLTFSGARTNHQAIAISTLTVAGAPTFQVPGGICNLAYSGKNVKNIDCEGSHNGMTVIRAHMLFRADPHQILVYDDDDQP